MLPSDATSMGTVVLAPAITVIVCTHNRCGMLDGALSSLFGVRMPADATMEVLVVDNASDDATKDVAARYAELHPGMLDYVFEPSLGLSNARNRALRHARGQILAFADDDILFDREWLLATLRAFGSGTGADCVGGRTLLAFERRAPRWLTPYLASVYGVGLDDPLPRRMQFPEHPYGLNMAFRRSVFERVGGFSTQLGRTGAKLLSGEETELFERVHRAGLVTVYAPDMIVEHRVPDRRARISWLVRRHFWGGISRATADGLSHPFAASHCTRRAYYELWHVLPTLVRSAGTSASPAGPGARSADRPVAGSALERLVRAVQHLGAALEYTRMAWRRRRRMSAGPRS